MLRGYMVTRHLDSLLVWPYPQQGISCVERVETLYPANALTAKRENGKQQQGEKRGGEEKERERKMEARNI
jgi:hypothetical protein